MSNELAGVRIVMVDDDHDDLFLTEICFKHSNMPVNFIGLKSAEELFSYIRDNGIGSIDILLLDLNMPKIGGVEVLNMLRTYPHYEDLNVFMFSTSSNESDVAVCLEAGAKAYLNKPSGIMEMRSFVKSIADYVGDQVLSVAS